MLKQNPETQQTSIKMSRNYFNTNPIARQLFSDAFHLNENEIVDSNIKQAIGILFSCMKYICFDIATDKNRSVESINKKITSLSSSPSLKALVAALKDVCSDVEVHPEYAKAKQDYLAAINKTSDAIKRLSEIDTSLEAKAIKYFKEFGTSLVSVAKEIAAEQKQNLNESLRIGFSGRVDNLKKELTNLILDSKDKDAKRGYGRDWFRLFQSMLQKLSAIDPDKSIHTDNDRKNLIELEKKTDTLGQEYEQYKVKAMEMAMSSIIKDPDLSSKFGDFVEMMTTALDNVSKVNTDHGIIKVKIREELEDKENKMNDRVFPLKQGDKDTDGKLKGSGLIAAIQEAMINSFAPIKNLMDARGGANGKYESATVVAVKAIQSALGNKDVNGNLDKPLLDSLLKLDQVPAENKEKIKAALSKLRETYSTVSENSNAVNAAKFFGINEGMTYIDPEDIDAKIKVYSEELAEDNSDITAGTSDASVADALAKILRTKNYNKNAEAEDFMREDGTLKGAYPAEFLEAWKKAASGDREAAFFFIEDEDGSGGLYPTKRVSCNINKPCNWKRYASISGHDQEDINNFGKWYTSYYKNFGGMNSDVKKSVIMGVFDDNCENAETAKLKEICSLYEDIKDVLIAHDKEVYSGYIRPSSFKRLEKIGEGLGLEDIAALKPNELRTLYNMVVLLCPSITFDSSEDSWVPALELFCKKLDLDQEELISEIKRSSYLGKPGEFPSEKVIVIDKPGENTGNEIIKSIVIGDAEESEKVAKMKSTLSRVKPIVKALSKHTKRMGVEKSDDITSDISDSIVVVSYSKKN